MKFVLILLLVTSTIISCKKTDPVPTCKDCIKNQDEINIDCGGTCQPCKIIYDESGLHGQNLLFGDSDHNVSASQPFSLEAQVPEGSNLTIKLVSNGIGLWVYNLSSKNNWNVSAYDNQEQTFVVLNSGKADLKLISFSGNSGSFRIEYYENNTSITKSKIITWN